MQISAKKSTYHRFKFPFILIAIISVILISCFIFFSTNVSVDTEDKTRNNVLGVETSLERQGRLIQTKKLEEANKYIADKPNPVQKIQMEGKLDSDPAKKQTIKSLEDLKKLYLFSYAYKTSNNQKYLGKAKEYLMAWVSIYKSTGNPIDESHLQQLFDSYGWLKESFTVEEKNKINIWLMSIADKEKSIKYKDGRDANNWNSHKINIIGQVGFLVGDQSLINYSLDEFKKQIAVNLSPDGGSLDLRDRDALSYHCYNLIALLRYAKISDQNGYSLYEYQSSKGSSLAKSVRYLYPYVSGAKSHKEFVNSKVAWDRVTASAGQPKSKIGRLFEPKDALEVLEFAYYFDETTLPLVQKIRNSKAEYPSFEIYFASLEKAK